MTATQELPADPDEIARQTAGMRSLARRLLRDGAAAEDAAQEAWLVALEGARRGDVPLTWWLRGVARNVARHFRRGAARRARHESAAARPEPAGEAAEVVAERAELHRRVAGAVLALDEPYRGALLLRYFEGLEPKEIAERQGVPAATVRSRVKRGIETLRGRLDAAHDGDRTRWGAALVVLAWPGTRDAARTVAEAARRSPSRLLPIAGLLTAAAILVAAVVLHDRDDGGGAASSGAPAKDVAASPASASRRGPGRARRAPGDDPVAPAPAGHDRSAQVRVTTEAGAAVEGALAVVHRDGRVVAAGRTGADGAAVFDVRDASGDLVVAAVGRPLVRGRVNAAPGAMAVVLPRGATLRGVCRVSGKEPGVPIALHLDVPVATIPEGDLPAAVWTELARAGFAPRATPGTTDAAGRFRFDGLPALDTAELAVDPGYVVQPSGSDRAPVTVPGPDVSIELLRMTRVRGRVVDPATGAPIAGARVFMGGLGEQPTYILGAGPTHMVNVIAEAGPDGRFDLPIDYRRMPDFLFSVGWPDRSGQHHAGVLGLRQVRVPWPEDAAVIEVGDVTPMRVRRVAVGVRDAAGAPVAGAVPSVGSQPGPPTDATGRTAVTIAEDDDRVSVGALGFSPASVEVAKDVDRIAVTLHPATLLEIEIRVADDGLTVPAVTVAVCGPAAAMFETEPGYDANEPSQAFLSVGNWESTTADDMRAACAWSVACPGRIALPALLPDTSFELRLGSVFGDLLATTTVSLAPGERRRIVLTSPRSARTLAGIVVDEDGRPVGDARVSLAQPPDAPQSDEGEPLTASTASDGRFRFTDLFPDRVALDVERRGSVPVHRILVTADAAATDEPIRVVLIATRSLRVRVADASGLPVPCATVTARPTTATPPSRPGAAPPPETAAVDRGGGTYELTGLAPGTYEVRAHVAAEALEESRPAEATAIVGAEAGGAEVVIRLEAHLRPR